MTTQYYSNGLHRQHVPAYGNCFFEAVVKKAEEDIDCTLLREQLSNNLQVNSNYISATGKSVEAKVLGGHSCIKCRFNCGEKINKEERLDIFNSYWNFVV
jgi:hypothetical protein